MAQQGAFGCIVRITISSTLTLIVDVQDVKWPAQERTLADVTAHDSPGGYAEFLPSGMRQLGEMTLTTIWDDAQATHAALLTNYGASAPVNMNVQDPLGQEVIAFAAFVKKIERKGEKDKAFMADVTIQPTGAPTIT